MVCKEKAYQVRVRKTEAYNMSWSGCGAPRQDGKENCRVQGVHVIQIWLPGETRLVPVDVPQ